jgi:hypothetical protein
MNQLQEADWKIPVQFEFTRRHTLQPNHSAEVGIATISGCGRAMISATKVPKCHHENFGEKPFKLQLIWID